MADDELGNFERVLGAFANIMPDREEPVLTGVRCPKCDATNFAHAEGVYDAAASRLANGRSDPAAKPVGGLADEEIVRRLAPPRRRSPIAGALIVAALLGGGAFYVNQRFGKDAGFLAAIAAVVLTIVFLLTRARALSDGYYAERARYKKLFICRNCGQLVDS
jgi:hypothetical protein